MSYDIFLYRKDGKTDPLKKTEIEKKLYPEFSVFEFNFDDGKDATYFWPYYSEKAQWSGFDYTYQKEGCYWVSCSFNVDKDELEYFKKEIREIAILLDFKIKDPQISEELFDPADYDPNDARGIKALEMVKEDMKPENISKLIGEKLTSAYPAEEESLDEKEKERTSKVLMTPAKEKYFIFYVIVSRKPKTVEEVYLTLDDGRFYASKVEKGEFLKDVIEREMKELTGGQIYKLIMIDEKYDSAPDKKGNILSRSRLVFKSNYFDVKTTKTKYQMKWNPLI